MQNELIPKKMVDILKVADTENDRCQKWPIPSELADTQNSWFSKCPILRMTDTGSIEWPIFLKGRYSWKVKLGDTENLQLIRVFLLKILTATRSKNVFCHQRARQSLLMSKRGRTWNEFGKRLTSSLCEWIGRKKILMSEWIISCKWIKVLKLMILTFRWLIIHPMTHLTWVMWPI